MREAALTEPLKCSDLGYILYETSEKYFYFLWSVFE